MTTTQRPALASHGEDLAAAHLERRGYSIIARNARTRFGEIDVIAHRRGELVFVEVKTRRISGGAGTALDAIDHRKVRQVRKLAAAWLTDTSDYPREEELRFDVIGVTLDRAGRLLALDHLEGAF
ncbi:MAG: YraN family protein [Solirubrobacteraceae bacterium]|nr:YraN family protein [Solirubrobacteraceae bacterium]